MSARINAWSMWLLASFFYAFQYVIRVLPNIMMADIMDKFQINASIFGQFSGVYYITYAGLHIPVGLMLDRYKLKYVLPVCILLTVGGLLPLIFADSWIYPVLGRAIIGLGASAAILGVFKIIRMAFPAEAFTRMLGISVTIGLLGGLYGGAPVNYLLTSLGWQNAIQMIVAMGVALAILTFLVIPGQTTRVQNTKAVSHAIISVMRNKMFFAVCILGGLMVGPMEGFADGWAKEFLKAVYTLDDSVSAGLPSLIFLGMCFGASLMSYITDKTKAYYPVIIFSALIMVCSFSLILTGAMSQKVLAVVFFIIGFFCAYQIPVIYKASTYVEEHHMGLATSCANMIIMLFGYIFHSSIGALMDQGVQQSGYLRDDFVFAITIIPIASGISALGFLKIYLSERRKTGRPLSPGL